MKRRMAITVFAVLCVAFAVAGPKGSMGHDDMGYAWRSADDYFPQEFAKLRTELSDVAFGELTLERLAPFAARLELAAAKDERVTQAASASFFLPGAGQFMNGDPGAGSLFALGHLALIGALAYSWYTCLPADLQFDELNYLSASFADIEARWMAHGLEDYLPSIGIFMGGMILDMAYRFASAESARRGARAGIDAGRIKVEPTAAYGLYGLRVLLE